MEERQAQPQVRVTVYLPADVEERLRIYAAVSNQSRSDVIVEYLRKLPDVQVSLSEPKSQRRPR